MSYDNYEGLTEEIQDIISRGDAGPKIPGWIDIVEKHLVTSLRDLRENMLETTGTFVVDQDYIDYPQGATNVRSLRIDSEPIRTVNVVSPDMFNNVTANAAKAGLDYPEAVMVHGETDGSTRLKLAPTPSNADDYTLFYMGTLAKVDQAKTTSQLLREAPLLLVYGACEQAMAWIQDTPNEAKWRAKFDKEKLIYRQFLSRIKFGGGPLRVRPDIMPNDRHTTWDIHR